MWLMRGKQTETNQMENIQSGRQSMFALALTSMHVGIIVPVPIKL